MKAFFKKYSHGWTFLYILIYFPWFVWLENRNVRYTMVHTIFDDMIPFCKYFVIPYFLWFLYVPAVSLFLFFRSKKEEFYKFSAMLFIGMTVSLFICTVWPNGQELRVHLNGQDDIFARIVSSLYQTDTSTNVFPSIHVYNSLVCHIALCKAEKMKERKIIKSLSFILMVSICLSTVLLKQHSFLDVLGAGALCTLMYIVVYHRDLIKSNEFLKKTIPGYKDTSSKSTR